MNPTPRAHPVSLEFKMKKNNIVISLFLSLVVYACAKKEPEIWFCPMHKHYQTDKPGDCPICGMKLVKKESSANAVYASKDKKSDSPTADKQPDEMKMQAPNTFTIPVDKQQTLNILTAKPQVRKLAMKFRLPAQVAYEPDLYTALVEYRQLMGQSSALPEGVSGAGLLRSAKLRIRQLGLGDDEIRQFAHSETAMSRLLVGNAGGRALISLQVSEGDIGLIKKGQNVVVTANAFQEKNFKGQIMGIGTLVDNKRRVVIVRALVADSLQNLRSQMFVSAEISLQAQKGLSLPRSAVFNTGVRQIVFVKKTDAEFSPVEVKIIGGNEEYAMISGVSAEDSIVVSSAFLLDSEARIRLEDYK
jgi:Cu(I)/Ag(I) efflux system membrane fusion protein